MKTAIEICKAIRNLPEQDLETKGVQILEQWQYQTNVLKTYPIFEKLKPFLSMQAKNMLQWTEGMEHMLNRGFHLAFIGIVVERHIWEKDNLVSVEDDITSQEYEAFAGHINKACDGGLIAHGIYVAPIAMPLAVVSASHRTMLLLHFYTKKHIQDLRNRSNVFGNEGELPHLLSEIKWNY